MRLCLAADADGGRRWEMQGLAIAAAKASYMPNYVRLGCASAGGRPQQRRVEEMAGEPQTPNEHRMDTIEANTASFIHLHIINASPERGRPCLYVYMCLVLLKPAHLISYIESCATISVVFP
jgi:hypothetical protein